MSKVVEFHSVVCCCQTVAWKKEEKAYRAKVLFLTNLLASYWTESYKLALMHLHAVTIFRVTTDV